MACFRHEQCLPDSPEVPWLTLGEPNPEFVFLLTKLKRENELDQGADVIRRIVQRWLFPQSPHSSQGRGRTEQSRGNRLVLCFHLARKEPARLKRYFEELARMPRDLELDDEVLLACFARAMDAWDPNRKVLWTTVNSPTWPVEWWPT